MPLGRVRVRRVVSLARFGSGGGQVVRPKTRSVLYATGVPPMESLISVDQEPSMTNPKIDREAMGRLAKAVAFICGPDHPTTMALKAAAVNGSDQEIKKARALFLRLSPGDRQAALNLLDD
jgi:hypothetical protein